LLERSKIAPIRRKYIFFLIIKH